MNENIYYYLLIFRFHHISVIYINTKKYIYCKSQISTNVKLFVMCNYSYNIFNFLLYQITKYYYVVIYTLCSRFSCTILYKCICMYKKKNFICYNLILLCPHISFKNFYVVTIAFRSHL